MINEIKKENLTTKKIFGYCLGDIFGGGAFTLVGMLYMNFLTDNILLSGAAVAIMMLIGKIWDAIIDPFIGNISEKATSKFGKRRIFFLAGIFHIASAFIALWLPLGTAKVWIKCIYFTLAYMLFATSFSLTMVPYHAMLPELTDDQKKRNRIVSIRSIFSNVSSMISGLVPAMLISFGATIAPGYGYLFMGICFGLFYTIPWIFVFFSTKNIDKPIEQKENINYSKTFIYFILLAIVLVVCGLLFYYSLGIEDLITKITLIIISILFFLLLSIVLVRTICSKIKHNKKLATLGIERINTKKQTNLFSDFIDNGKIVMKNRSFRKMLGLYLLSYTAMDIFMAIFIYFVKWYLGIYGVRNILGLGAYTFLLGVFMIFELISIPIYTRLATKIGKRFAFICSTSLWSTATLVLFFMASPLSISKSIIFAIIPAALMGLGAGGVAYIPWSMLPETMDVEELKTGVRKDGIYSGFLTFIRQLSQAVALAIVGFFLDAIDYNIGSVLQELNITNTIDNLTSSEYLQMVQNIPYATSFGIKLFTTFAPLILLVLSCIISFGYPITNKNYQLLINEIKNRDTVDKQEILELEKMAGTKYETFSKNKRIE